MEKPVNLSEQIKTQLPPELVDFMRLAGEAAQRRGQGLYLVGGVVRDLLLERTNLDIDLVVEGDAIELAKELAQSRQGQITTHARFGTAKVRWNGWSADLATARAETYAKPGALPTVKPGKIDADLFRRDFTINAMALRLDPGRYGELVDLYGGLNDLERKIVSILHEKSFIDDATRIWRAIRYEQRLDFTIEPRTLALLKRDVPMLDTISGDRIRHELERVLEEEYPEKALRRADGLGVLAKLHPALKGDGGLAERFALARQLAPGCDPPDKALYLALLAYRLSPQESEELASYLKLPRATSQVMQQTIELKSKLGALAEPDLPLSGIYSLLAGFVPLAVTANMLACDSSLVRERLQAFQDRLRHVRPLLTGNDLKKMVITGPRIKEVLESLRAARLDGKVRSREDEVAMVREMEKERRV